MSSMMLSGFDLRFASDIPIPGAISGDGSGHDDVIPVLIGKPRPISGKGQFARVGDDIVYTHSTGCFRCSGTRIAIEPGEPFDQDDLGALLVANALPAILWQRGCFVLHAAGLRLPGGKTVAIAGPRGSGKSRLLADLVQAGAAPIGDDSLSLRTSEAQVTAAGLPGGWYERAPGAAERTFRTAPAASSGGATALDLLVFLDGPAMALAPVPTLSALELLLRHRHRPQVPQLLGRESDGLRQAALIASRLPAVAVSPQALLEKGTGPIREALTDLALNCNRDN